MTILFDDDQLTKDLNDDNSPGAQSVAKILIDVPVEERAAIAAEARTMANYSPGWRYSDAVWYIADSYVKTGTVSTRYRDMAREDAARERARRGY